MKNLIRNVFLEFAIQILMVLVTLFVVLSCCERNWILAMVGFSARSCLWYIHRVIDEMKGGDK